MTETKTKFEIQPAPAAFDFNYIASHWLVLISVPLGMIPLGEGIAINPGTVSSLELIEMMEPDSEAPPGVEPAMVLAGEAGILLRLVGGGEIEIDSDQSSDLEKIMKRVEKAVRQAGHPGSLDEMINSVGGSPAQGGIIQVPNLARVK